MTLDEIYKEIKLAEKFVILTHEAPDGDAIGSACAMALALKNMGKSVIDVYLKEYPANYKFIPGIEFINEEPKNIEYDVAIVLDCPNITRVSSCYRTFFENANVKIQFDHHHKNSMFGDYNIVNPVSPACAQILSSSFDYLKIEITKDIATAILTGIITDTLGFRTPETTTESFEFAGFALSKGVNVSNVYKQVFTTISKTRFDIQNLASERLELFADGKIAYTYITKEDEKKYGTKTGDLSSIVEIGRNIEGVEVSVFIYEKEKGYKLSVRSNNYVDCLEIAMTFGGGGHLRAAGANLLLELEDAKKQVIEQIEKYLK